MEYEKPIQAASFSKKLSSGGLMAPAKAHPYDGVFANGRSGRLRSSGAVVDDSDYAEIFRAGSTACSIPVLDIPEPFDPTSGGGRSSRPVDYSKIFGGFGDSTDFAVPFEELLPPKPNSSDGAAPRTPAETRTRSSGRSRQLSFSEEKREPSRRPPEQPSAGAKEFNVLYNRSNPGSQNGESRTVRVPELHSVNGYTRLADDAVPSRVTDVGSKDDRSVLNDAHARVGDNIGELPRIPKLSRRAVSGPQPRVVAGEASHRYAAVSGPQPRVDAREASRTYAESRRRSGRSGSLSNDMFDAFETGIGAHSSGVPLPSSTTSRARNYSGASRSNIPEHERRNHSPSFSDEEVDANSVAAASAAAVRKAIEEAQAKIKLAKELMEKEGRVNFAKMNFGNGFKAEKKSTRTEEMLNSSREKEAQEMNGKEQVSSFIGRMSNHGQRIASQVSPDLRDKKEFSTAHASRGLHGKESSSSLFNQTAEAYVNERTRTSQSDVAVKHDSVTLECEGTDIMKNVTPSARENGLGKNMKTEEKSEKLTECLKGTEVTEEDMEHGKVKSEIEIVPGTFQWNFDANSFKSAQELEHEDGHELEVHDLGEADQASNVAHEHEQEEQQLESKLDEFKVGEEMKDMLKSQGDDWDMPEMGEASSGVETTDHETEGCNQDLEVSGTDEVFLRENYERKQEETDLQNGKPREWEITDCQKNREENLIPEVDEYRESNGHWQDNEMEYNEICEENVVELRSNDLDGKQESNRGEGEDGVRGHDKKETVAMSNQILNVYYLMDMPENLLKSRSETGETQSETHLSMGDKEDMEVPHQASMDKDENYVDADAIYNQDELENFRETEEGGWYEETLEGVSVTAERMESSVDANGTEESDKEWEAGEDDNGAEEDGFDAVPHAQVFSNIKHTMQGIETLVIRNNTESATETDFLSQQKQGEDHLGGILDVHDQETRVEEIVWVSDESDGDIDESKVGCNEEEDESYTVCGNVIESRAPCVIPEKTVEEVEETMMSSDVEEINVTNEDEIASIHGEEDNASQSSHEEIRMDNHIHVETAEQPSSSEGVGRMTEVSLETQFQSSENKEESRHKAEEKDVASQSEVGIQDKRNLEKDELREKERQRVVVDRAIKEARERAFAEARERAERAAADKAAAETRQRETAAASKKPEKAPSEANGKLAADKAAKDAKLKAERAAVERATNEARERALEKALAEKDAAKARNQAAKTAADGAESRNNRSYDHQQNGNVTSSSLRQPSSSHHAALNPAEKAGVPNNVNESAYWSKATLERHQRTAERAAKALAEKNMRDFLAQREQAERHRLAETLDADVKRWSSGKERNLRALLSTLQYILGSDSGWQPIPLTDLVSTAAVKKAYRKATLVVHPDKLQQRGASIQQKYTCEKVFDLLQESWNKFSAEER